MIRLLILLVAVLSHSMVQANVRLKDVARIDGNREIALVGYGLVVGLSGTGDSSKNKATHQSLMNTLNRFGLQVDERDLNARNVAAVMITSTLPAYSEPGDKVDLRVASTGDAKSLNGGTLLLAPLYGPDKKLYVLGQGALTVGGYRVESFSNLTKKNHTTVGQIAGGGSVEQSPPVFLNVSEEVNIVLNEPDFTTANRIVTEIKRTFDIASVRAVHPGKVKLELPDNIVPMEFVARLESVVVKPDLDARVVVNERTGTIVAGSNVVLGEVSVAHGNLRIEIETKFDVSQPLLVRSTGPGVQTEVIPDTSINVVETSSKPLTMKDGSTVGDLVQALYKLKLSTRDTISILESIKAAGALHAELIIQ